MKRIVLFEQKLSKKENPGKKKSLKEYRLSLEKQRPVRTRAPGLVGAIMEELGDMEEDVDEAQVSSAVEEAYKGYDENELKSPLVQQAIKTKIIESILNQNKVAPLSELYNKVYDIAEARGFKKSMINEAFDTALQSNGLHFQTNYVCLKSTSPIEDDFWETIKKMSKR
jgi:hypothetical protein